MKPRRYVKEMDPGWRTRHHGQRFCAEGNVTRITDEVQYALPFGVIGRVVHRLKVKRDVEGIFAYRRRVAEEKLVNGDW